jgi:hypothetical protein
MRHFSDVSENPHRPETLSIALCWTLEKDISWHGVVLTFNGGQYRALQVVVDKLSTGMKAVDKWCFSVCQGIFSYMHMTN